MSHIVGGTNFINERRKKRRERKKKRRKGKERGRRKGRESFEKKWVAAAK